MLLKRGEHCFILATSRLRESSLNRDTTLRRTNISEHLHRPTAAILKINQADQRSKKDRELIGRQTTTQLVMRINMRIKASKSNADHP